MIKKLTMVSLTALSLAMMPQVAVAGPDSAAAQGDEQKEDKKDDGDIVVTATRQETFLQDTPLAITAVTAETLEARGLSSTADLSQAVPNATFRRVQGAFGPAVSAFIRGIGQADTSLGSEPSVAYYIDDIYYPILLGSNFDLLDLDHVEVLRGPQGTLFGRNALAGAVNIVSKKPSLDDLSAYTQITTGSYNRLDVRAGVNVPLTSSMALSVSGLSKKRKGYQKILDFRCEMVRKGTPALAGRLPFYDAINTPASNFSPSDCEVGTLGGEDVQAARGTLYWEPASNVSLTVNADWIRDRSENPADQTVAITGPGANNLVAQSNYFGVPYDSRFVTGDPFTTYASYFDPVGSGVVIPAYAAGAAYTGSPASTASTFHNGFGPQRGGAVFPNHYKVDTWGISGKLVVGLTDNIDFTAIVGYRKVLDTHAFDVDGSPLVLEHTLLNIGEDYRNAEVRLSGQSSFIDWVAGAFYFEGDGFTHAITYSPQSGFFRVQNIDYQPKSKAVFANATVKPFEGFNVTAGGRYSNDEKYVDFTNLPDDPRVAGIVFKVFPKATRFDWKLGADYHVTDDVMVYASASTGARLPGYNPRPQQQTQVITFDGEETLAYELGIKADLFDKRLRINATGFYTDYKTRITNVTGAEANLSTGSRVAGTCVLVDFPAGGAGATQCRAAAYNAGTDGPVNLAGGIGITSIPRTYFINTPGTGKGFELEVEARPVDGLLINAALGYSKFTSPDLKIATRANDRIAGLPDLNGTVGIQYRAEVEGLDGSITPRLDWFYTGSIAFSAARNTYNQAAYSQFNVRLTYNNDVHDFSIAVGATNVFDKLYYRNYFVYQDIGFPNSNGQPAPPREWFVQFNKRF